MNDLERLIRKLTLRAPSKTMDLHVLSLLRIRAMSADKGNGFEKASSESGVCIREAEPTAEFRSAGSERLEVLPGPASGPVLRNGIASPFAWVAVAASLVIGIVIGQRLPKSIGEGAVPVGVIDEADRGKSNALGNSRFSDAREAIAEVTERDGTPPQLAESSAESNAVSTGGTTEASGAASQLVESVSMSPRDAAVQWEQHTGQVFEVATHVRDRRFNMCRECHRIGG